MRWWSSNSVVRSYNDDRDWTDNARVDKTFTVVTLNNGLVRVTVAPDLGMRVLRVRDLSVSPEREMFAVMTSPANEVTFAQNIGGVKPPFPLLRELHGHDQCGGRA